MRSTCVWWSGSAGVGTWRVGQCGQGGIVSWDPLLGATGGGGYAVEVLGLPDVPVQCRPIRVGEGGLGQGRGGVRKVILRGL